MREDGTAQVQRRDLALNGDVFRVDDLGLHARILAAREFGAKLRLNSTEGSDGSQALSWASLFDHDEWMLLACVSAAALGSLREDVDRDHDAMPIDRLAVQVLRLCAQVDTWYRRACVVEGPGAHALAQGLAQTIGRHLCDHLRWIQSDLAPHGWEGQIQGYEHGALASVWFSTPVLASNRLGRGEREMLRSLHGALCDAVVRTQAHARELMSASWTSGQHEAAVGLLAVFFSLHESVVGHLNGFGARHRDFYFRDVLGLRQKDPEPEWVHLACVPAAQRLRDAQVPHGTRFLAGPDANGQLRQVETQGGLALNGARVACLHSLRLVQGTVALGSGADARRWNGVTRLWADTWEATGPEAPVDGRFRALLGGHVPQARPTHAPARIGMGVVCELLRLAEGEREIRLRLALRDADGHESLWRQLAAGDPDIQWQFARALPNMFDVELTGPQGWWPVRDQSLTRLAPTRSGAQDCLELRLRLRATDPAVGPAAAEFPLEPWVGSRPAIRLVLREDAPLCAYTLLSSVRMLHAELTVSARGVRNLVLRNQLGRLDPTAPFMPFGPMPRPGDHLSVGAGELNGKPLQALCLHLRWSGLPRGEGGFLAHYAGYDSNFRRGSFSVRTALAKSGLWQLSAAARDGLELFESAGGEALRLTRSINIHRDDLRAQYEASHAPVGEVGAAVLLLELNEPAAAFGHQEYAQVLTRVVSANARRRLRQLPVPNAPYTPTVQAAWLDYEAAVERKLTEGVGSAAGVGIELVHLWPLGWQVLDPSPGGLALCPQWTAHGHLHIGLVGAEPGQTQCLLFDLRSQAAQTPPPGAGAQLDVVRWEALCATGWVPLRGQDLLSDGTAELLSSGVVRLVLPQAMVSDSPLMSPGKLWLRLSARALPERCAGLYGVYTQGVRARRVFDVTGPGADHRPLGPRSVTGPHATLPGLLAVHQVGPAFGQRAPESESAFQVRTAERLRHKARAASPWDYERLLLERFGAVLKAKCFPNLRAVRDPQHPEGVRVQVGPGEVMLAVLPHLSGDEDDRELLGPQFHTAELDEMADFLTGVSSPFSRITVRNAAYESLQVRAQVRWARRGSIGALRDDVELRLRRGLSPWRDAGRHAHFEWHIDCAEAESLIRSTPGVEDVSGVSILRVASSDAGVHHLYDSARPGGADQWQPEPGPSVDRKVQARWPWSVAVAQRRHLIETATAGASSRTRPSGIGQLSLGQTWVIGA